MGTKQDQFFDVITRLGISVDKERNFPWLKNQVTPDNELIWKIFLQLGGVPEAMQNKNPRRLSPDGFLPDYNCIIEFDELQHFTLFRQKTLEFYPHDADLGFKVDAYRSWCNEHSAVALKKGPSGYRKPKPEFPFENGRAAQRALFDACRDILPLCFGLRPTVRIAEFQLPSLGKDGVAAEAEVLDTLDFMLRNSDR